MPNGLECPECDGFGTKRAIGCGKKGPVALALDCELCGNTGKLSKEQLAWRKEGRKMKMDRLDRRFTLRMEAERRGMEPLELSRMERGIIAPVRG